MKNLIVGITGASGIRYGYHLLRALKNSDDIETHLIVSKASLCVIREELTISPNELTALADYHYDAADISAPVASGSFKTTGMIIAPCTAKTLSAIANAYTDNLIARAADVCLKERRKLVLLFRETPLNLAHIENMARITRMGGIILPPVPAFYHRPETIADIIRQTIGKALDLFDIDHNLFKRWGHASGTNGLDEQR